MRVTGGRLKGRELFGPKSAEIRPMRDQVRTALYNILGDVIEGSLFLDLFAGTGSVGIEALSRGARHAVFVDSSARAVQIIHKNLQQLDLTKQASVYREDVFQALESLSQRGQRFDLVFVGPPYGLGLADGTLAKIAELSVLNPDAMVVTEIFKKEMMQDHYGALGLFDERLYGDNRMKFYRKTSPTGTLCQSGLM
jgi:16S rRNA (guanine966-N2)-methyltransferase